MKTITYITGLLLVALFTSFSSVDAVPGTPKPNTYEAIEANRLIGLASDNRGLRLSCAYYLGEMQSYNAVIPLMKILREGQTSEERVVAALSLVK